MSALDILRSFAEARCENDEPIREGITYGVARALLAHVTELQAHRDIVHGFYKVAARERDHERFMNEQLRANLTVALDGVECMTKMVEHERHQCALHENEARALAARVPKPEHLEDAIYSLELEAANVSRAKPHRKAYYDEVIAHLRATLPPTQVVANDGVPLDAAVVASGDTRVTVRGLAPTKEDDDA